MNRQYEELREKNPNAFVWVDDPGLGLIFTAFSGYNEGQAKEDLDRFLGGLKGPKGIHLCARPDWDFLLKSKIDILSFDSFNCGTVIVNYPSLRDFFDGEESSPGGSCLPIRNSWNEKPSTLWQNDWRLFGTISPRKGLIRESFSINPCWHRPPAIS